MITYISCCLKCFRVEWVLLLPLKKLVCSSFMAHKTFLHFFSRTKTSHTYSTYQNFTWIRNHLFNSFLSLKFLVKMIALSYINSFGKLEVNKKMWTLKVLDNRNWNFYFSFIVCCFNNSIIYSIKMCTTSKSKVFSLSYFFAVWKWQGWGFHAQLKEFFKYFQVFCRQFFHILLSRGLFSHSIFNFQLIISNIYENEFEINSKRNFYSEILLKISKFYS